MIKPIILSLALLVAARAGASAAADCVPFSEGWNDFSPCTRVDSSGQRWVMYGRIWTPPDCNIIRHIQDQRPQLLTYIRLPDAA